VNLAVFRKRVLLIAALLPLCATTVIEPWQRESVPPGIKDTNGTPQPDARTPGAKTYPPFTS
jgi:hypothetical protein